MTQSDGSEVREWMVVNKVVLGGDDRTGYRHNN